MTKIEWCRRNAPGALHDLSDDELLDYMSDAYRSHLLFLAKRLLVDLIYSQAHVENICVTFAETNEIINNISSSAKPDANKVNEYILYRTQGVGADWQNFPFNEIVEREYRHAYDSLRLDSIRQGVKLEHVEFDLAYKRFNTIA